jgi:hypothetical protein
MCRFVLLYFLAFLCLLAIADTRLFSLTFQQTLGSFLTVAFWASWSESAKVSSDSLSSTLCGYLRSNHIFGRDVKQDRRRKSVSDADVEAARKEKNCIRKIAHRRGSTPQDRKFFYGAILV